VKIEERPYGPGSTPAEVEAMLARVRVIEERIVLWHEIPVQSPFSISIMSERLQELVRGWDHFCEIVDLREARRPDAETRRVLKHKLSELQPRLDHLACIVGRNVVIAAMVKLVAYANGVRNVSLHADLPGALEASRHAQL
jgi:hypothetical protein